MAKVYVKLEDKIITEINSSVFLDDTTDYKCIDEGEGDRFTHAQGNYLEKGLTDEKGRFNYKYSYNKVKELTEEEKEALFPVEVVPTEYEVLDARITYLEIMSEVF